MYTMVRNRSLNHLQLVKSRQAGIEAMSTTMDPTVPAQAEDNLAAEALGKRIREWINELPPKRREAFRLSRFDGLTHEEIADVMEIAPRTVTNHIMLALQYVRDRLRVYRSEGG
jgi:RNA polymerase sigma-70 factor (ECF subfamily)